MGGRDSLSTPGGSRRQGFGWPGLPHRRASILWQNPLPDEKAHLVAIGGGTLEEHGPQVLASLETLVQALGTGLGDL